MGKLLRKLVNGIVPSWLTKIKSSADASPKKLLPSFRGGTLASSHKSPASPAPSSAPKNSEALVLADPDHDDQLSEDEEMPSAEACEENTVILESPSLRRTTSIGQKADKNDDKRHHQDHDDTHHLPLVDVKALYNSQDMRNHGMQSSNPSSRKQEILSIDKDNDEYDHHPQKHHKNHEDRNHRAEHHGNHAESEKNSQFMQEDTNSYHIYKKGHGPAGAHNGYDYHTKGYHDLLGFKRTSQYFEVEEEEEEDGSSSSSSSSMTGWGWKRRKGERGVMSCELPESICCIVGNSKAVVKHSQEPHLVLWESMVEMIVGNGLWELGSLEFLLFCYLSLNEPHLHPIIQSSFLQVLKDLERTS